MVDNRSHSASRLAVVIPCYNEEEALRCTLDKLTEHLNDLIERQIVAADSYLLFVDDGSHDSTWSTIESTSNQNHSIKAIHLAVNSGHQNALLAGLLTVKDKCDCAITIDADLQDDYSQFENMVDAFRKGNDIVCVLNGNRKTDTFFKRNSAIIYYKLLDVLGCKIITNHADYRLMSAKTIRFLESFPERNLFLRGIVPLLSQNISYIYQNRSSRQQGIEKYTLRKMLSLAWTGITSFSIAPLRLMLLTGLVIFILSLCIGMWVLWAKFTDATVPGWASTVLPIYFIGGIQLLATGLLGEYVGKIYMEAKSRPLYLIDKKII